MADLEASGNAGEPSMMREYPSRPMAGTHHVYVLRCADGSLYTGYATDVNRRLKVHLQGRGAKYTRSRLPVELVRSWSYPDHSSALRAEAAFKRLGRERKLSMLAAPHGVDAADESSVPFVGCPGDLPAVT